ncbi:MAG TPA: subclass B1 metallo-beta-lactamase [Prolixibacteraceae bacterium]|jgi:metallo-beta-lactamase class B
MKKLTNYSAICLVVLFYLSTASAQGISKKITINNDLELVQLTPNVYMHISYAEFGGFGRVACNGMILTDGDKAFLFDTPPTDQLTRQLIEWISQNLRLEIVGFIPNHWHVDCMGGLESLRSIGVKTYANQLTIDIATAKNLPVPEHGFTDSISLKLGNKEIDCYYLGAGHSMDNIVVWIPSEKVLFPGCLVKELKANGLGNTVDGDLKAYPQTIDKVLRKFPQAKIVIPGHGAYGGLDLITHTRDLLTKH